MSVYISNIKEYIYHNELLNNIWTYFLSFINPPSVEPTDLPLNSNLLVYTNKDCSYCYDKVSGDISISFHKFSEGEEKGSEPTDNSTDNNSVDNKLKIETPLSEEDEKFLHKNTEMEDSIYDSSDDEFWN